MVTMTTPAPTHPDTITPADASTALAGGSQFIDVRELVEYAEARVAGAVLIPLGSLKSHAGEIDRSRPVIVMCQAGKRGAAAAEKLRALGFTSVRNLAGGLNAWKESGHPCESDAKPPMPLMRQVQIVIGSFVLFGSLLAAFGDPRWIYLPMFFGAGLIFAGTTGFGGLALILARMPWNRRTAKRISCSGGKCFLILFAAVSTVRAQRLDYEEEPHNYWTAPLTDTCTAMDKALDSGAMKLTLNDGRKVLEETLAALKVPVETQVLVFSRTSFQRDRIRPDTPRALYFNDECYVGWVPGGLTELAGVDPNLGPIFYSLNTGRTDRAVARLDRAVDCMNCHGTSMTNRVPGVMLRSVFPDSDGNVLLQAGTSLIDHTSPIEDRWGGWYVTGKHGAVQHMGNGIAVQAKDGTVTLDKTKGANIISLTPFFDTSRYPRADSDIVALMTLEHQAGMQSRLVEAAYDVRIAIRRQTDLRRELGEPATKDYGGSCLTVANSHMEKTMKSLLFCEEAAMPEGGVDGGPAFQEAFRANRRATPDGRSLKDFQLLTRVFKYRCSYLIYSRTWDALPERFRAMLYRRLYDILTAKEAVKGYEHLGAPERRDILNILRATKQGLPDYWKGT